MINPDEQPQGGREGSRRSRSSPRPFLLPLLPPNDTCPVFMCVCICQVFVLRVCVCVCVCRERGPPMTAEKIPRVSRKSTDFPPTDRLTATARTKISTEEPVHVLNTSPAKRLLRSKRIGKSMKLHGRKILRPLNPMIYIYHIYIVSKGTGGRGKEGEGGSPR